MRLHLIDRLGEARLRVPRPEHVGVHTISVRRDARPSIFAHPPSEIEFSSLRASEGARLVGAVGLKDACRARMRGAVSFRVSLAAGRWGRLRTVWEWELDPAREAVGWQGFSIPCAAGRLRIALQTAMSGGAVPDYAWAGWADPVLEGAVAPAAKRPPPSAPCLVLVTCDELRADHLGCYGPHAFATPAFDALAESGVRFANARSRSSNTLEAYANLLTGCARRRHTVREEWGQLAPGLPTLADRARQAGFRAVAFTSERDISDPANGLFRGFDRVFPCAGEPAQDGAITVRRFERWLDARPAGGFFSWIHLFDTHQPLVAPEPYRSAFVTGDPTDPARAHRVEALQRIRGIETLQVFVETLPLLERGGRSLPLVLRLRAVLATLRGHCPSGPDTVSHLRHLGPPARLGLSEPEFCAWLERQLVRLEHGDASPELLAWMRQTIALLRPIEADILGWLDGVVDFRFALAQYRAAVAYVDALVGEVVNALQARGLYDGATLVVTTPHGEMLDERDCSFYNHALHESVLATPLVIKPGQPGFSGRVVDGLFESVDLVPTLCDAMGWGVASGVDGVSHWNAALAGALPARPAFARDSVSSCVVDGTDKLIAFAAPHRASDRWCWQTGDRAWFDLAHPDGEEAEHVPSPERCAALERALQEWLVQDGT